MKPIEKTTNDFPSIMRDGQVYVDKTAYFPAAQNPDSGLLGDLAPAKGN